MIDQARDIVALLSESGLKTRRERSAFVARLRDKHRLKFKQIGQQLNVTPQRAHQLYGLHGILKAMDEAEDDDEEDIQSKDFHLAATSQGATISIAEFLNQRGFMGQFKMWPKGTFPGAEEYDFVMTVSDEMAHAWEEGRRPWQQFDLVLSAMGYEYDLEGEPGEPRTFHFFKSAE